MATSVLRPPDSVQNDRDPGSASPRPHAPAGGGSRGPGGGSRGVTRARLAALIAAAAATGMLAGTGVLLATGTPATRAS